MSSNSIVTNGVIQSGIKHCEDVLHHENEAKLFWIQHPTVRRHINRQISGQPDIDWLSWFKTHYAEKPFEYGLSLGCGTGRVEREALKNNICLHFDGIDITPDSIQMANRLAEQYNMQDYLKYHVRDLNSTILDYRKYDFIIISHALHHIRNLKHILKQLRRTLKPAGIILMSEYIGPAQFQFTDKQLYLMNKLLDELPQKYKLNLRIQDRTEYKTSIIRPSREFMIEWDPSEAVRSDEIIPLVKKYFHILTRRDYGGTLLQFLLADIAGNFDDINIEDRNILEKLAEYERNLIDKKELESDFAILVMKKKNNWFNFLEFRQ